MAWRAISSAPAFTWRLCRQHVDKVVLVQEDEIAGAMRWALEVPHFAAGGKCCARHRRAAAGLLDLTDRHVAVVTTGRNVSLETLRSILE